MTREQLNAAILALSLVGAIVCFSLGRTEAGMVLVAFAGGHAAPSPIQKGGPE